MGLGHRVHLINFRRNCFFPKVVAPVYIPISSVWECSLHILPNFSHSSWCMVAFHCSIWFVPCQWPMRLKCLNVFLRWSIVSNLLVIFKLGCLFYYLVIKLLHTSEDRSFHRYWYCEYFFPHFVLCPFHFLNAVFWRAGVLDNTFP